MMMAVMISMVLIAIIDRYLFRMINYLLVVLKVDLSADLLAGRKVVLKVDL